MIRTDNSTSIDFILTTKTAVCIYVKIDVDKEHWQVFRIANFLHKYMISQGLFSIRNLVNMRYFMAIKLISYD